MSTVVVKELPALSYSLRKAFSPTWLEVKPRATALPLEPPKEMLPWQSKRFYLLRDLPFFIIVAYCGSGKSILFIFYQIYDVISSGWTRKQLTLVPQRGIGDGFSRDEARPAKHLNYEGQSIIWNPLNLCDPFRENHIRELRNFLLSDTSNLLRGHQIGGNTLTGLNCVATHSAFVGLWKDFTKKEKKQAAKNLSLYIDECHHVTAEDIEEATEISRALGDLMSFEDPTFKLRMTTATLFRGDNSKVFSDMYRKLFKINRLDIEEFLEISKIEELQYYFVHYKGEDPNDTIVKNILKEPDQYHLVIYPRMLQERSNFRKVSTLNNLLTGLREAGLEVLDLVTPETQDKNWASFNANKNKYHVLVACNLFNEGKDWPALNRLHDTAYSDSPVLTHQKVGRTLRQYKGKRDVKVIVYQKEFPRELKTEQKERIREIYSDRFNILISLMLIEDMFNPIKIPRMIRIKGEDKNVSLSSLLEDDYFRFTEELVRRYELVSDKTDSTELVAAIRSVAKQFHIDVQDEVSLEDFEIAAQRYLLRLNVIRKYGTREKVEQIDTSFLREGGLDHIIVKESMLGSLVFGTSENILKMFPKYRDILKTKGLVESNDRIEFEKMGMKSLAVPTQFTGVLNRDYRGRWVKLKDGKIVFVMGVEKEKANVKVYPRRKVQYRNGKIFLGRDGSERELDNKHAGWWRPSFCLDGMPIRKEYLEDEKISERTEIPLKSIVKILL